jgi:hypothetical protein
MTKSAQIISINRRLERAWADYLECKTTAEETGSLADGIEAGRAWRRWLDCFMSTEQKTALDAATVIGLRR